jgi:hypothetical protein
MADASLAAKADEAKAESEECSKLVRSLSARNLELVRDHF